LAPFESASVVAETSSELEASVLVIPLICPAILRRSSIILLNPCAMTPTSSSVRTGTSCVRSPPAALSVTSLTAEIDLVILRIMRTAKTQPTAMPASATTRNMTCMDCAEEASRSKFFFWALMVASPISRSTVARGASMPLNSESTVTASLPVRIIAISSFPFFSYSAISASAFAIRSFSGPLACFEIAFTCSFMSAIILSNSSA